MTRRDRPDAGLVAARGGDRRAFAVLVERRSGVLLATSTDRPERHIVVLEEVGGGQRLPIWIGLAAEVSAPGDSASVLADEVRARLAELAREFAELSQPPAEPGHAS
jgi:hypothetical protein